MTVTRAMNNKRDELLIFHAHQERESSPCCSVMVPRDADDTKAGDRGEILDCEKLSRRDGDVKRSTRPLREAATAPQPASPKLRRMLFLRAL
jgi:hypothetical protein